MASINQNIQTFYTQAANKDFARDFLFRVVRMQGVGLPDLKDEDLVYVKAAQLPGRTIENINASYMGLKFNIPGVATYDSSDSGNHYTNGLESTVISQYRTDSEEPLVFVNQEDERVMYYPLKDCFNQLRPRSGINKLLYLSPNGSSYSSNQYVDSLTRFVSRRPRYYMSSKIDPFKYWTSYRTESDSAYTGNSSSSTTFSEYGVSKKINNDGSNYISDAAPFVVYNEKIPTNRVIIKMQTNVGDIDLGPFQTISGQ